MDGTVAEWGLLVGAVGVLITAIAGAVVSVITVLRLPARVEAIEKGVQRVGHELATLNGSTVGQLADADETRRVEAIPVKDRTPGEAEHIAIVPPPEL